MHQHPHPQRVWLSRLDTVAIGLSGLCAIHCAALPLVMLLLPFLGSHEFEGTLRWALAAMGIVGIGIGALTHRNYRALPLLLVALVILAVGEFVGHGPLEIFTSIAASICLVRAHWLNTIACRTPVASHSAAERS